MGIKPSLTKQNRQQVEINTVRWKTQHNICMIVPKKYDSSEKAHN